jgi:hypothetical protein
MSGGKDILPTEMLHAGQAALFKIKGHSNDFVRLGNLGEGSCFYYAFLHSLCGKNFIEMPLKDSRNAVKIFREKLALFFTYEKFKKCKLSTFLSHVYFIYYNESFAHFKKKAKFSSDLEELYQEFANNKEFSSSIMSVENITESLPKKLANLYEKINKKAFEIFQDYLKTYERDAGEEIIALMEEIFHVNIIVLDKNGKNRRTSLAEDESRNKNPFLLVYYLDFFHYESVGIIRKDESGEKKVFFKFSHKDEDIKKLLNARQDED